MVSATLETTNNPHPYYLFNTTDVDQVPRRLTMEEHAAALWWFRDSDEESRETILEAYRLHCARLERQTRSAGQGGF